jgi:uncharacterized protein
MDALTILPFALLMTAVLGLWMRRYVWVAALVAAVAAGYFTGALQGLAAVWIAVAAALAVGYCRARAASNRALQLTAGIAFGVFATAMGLALLPGFIRVDLVPAQVLSPGAAPYAIAVGFPKVVTGILILGLINPALPRSGLAKVLASAAPVFVLTTAAVIAFTLALGYTAFAPKWTALFWLWAVINLFFTCLSEEAFFRGFVQAELSGAGRGHRALAALVAGAVLFGLAHFGGGLTYVIAGLIAGLGYGWAFLRTQRIEAAMAVHFGVNATHFLLFVYPRLA